MHKENPELKTNLSRNYVKDLIIYDALKNIEKRLKQRISDDTIGMNEYDISEDVAMQLKDIDPNQPETFKNSLYPVKRYTLSYNADRNLRSNSPKVIKYTKEPESSTANTNTVEPERPLNMGTDYSLDNVGAHDILQHKHQKDNHAHHSSSKVHYSNHSFESNNASSSQSEKQSLVLLKKAVLNKDIDTVFKDANKSFHEIINKHNEMKNKNDDARNDSRHNNISASSMTEKSYKPVVKKESSNSHRNQSTNVIKEIDSDKDIRFVEEESTKKDIFNGNENINVIEGKNKLNELVSQKEARDITASKERKSRRKYTSKTNGHSETRKNAKVASVEVMGDTREESDKNHDKSHHTGFELKRSKSENSGTHLRRKNNDVHSTKWDSDESAESNRKDIHKTNTSSRQKKEKAVLKESTSIHGHENQTKTVKNEFKSEIGKEPNNKSKAIESLHEFLNNRKKSDMDWKKQKNVHEKISSDENEMKIKDGGTESREIYNDNTTKSLDEAKHKTRQKKVNEERKENHVKTRDDDILMYKFTPTNLPETTRITSILDSEEDNPGSGNEGDKKNTSTQVQSKSGIIKHSHENDSDILSTETIDSQGNANDKDVSISEHEGEKVAMEDRHISSETRSDEKSDEASVESAKKVNNRNSRKLKKVVNRKKSLAAIKYETRFEKSAEEKENTLKNKDIGDDRKSAGQITNTHHKNNSFDDVSPESNLSVQEEEIPTKTSVDSDQYSIIESLHQISKNGKDSSKKRGDKTTSEDDVSIEIQSIEDDDSSNFKDGTNKQIKNSRIERVLTDNRSHRKENQVGNHAKESNDTKEIVVDIENKDSMDSSNRNDSLLMTKKGKIRVKDKTSLDSILKTINQSKDVSSLENKSSDVNEGEEPKLKVREHIFEEKVNDDKKVDHGRSTSNLKNQISNTQIETKKANGSKNSNITSSKKSAIFQPTIDNIFQESSMEEVTLATLKYKKHSKVTPSDNMVVNIQKMDLSEGKKSATLHHVKKGHTSKHHHYEEKRHDRQSGNKWATRYAVNTKSSEKYVHTPMEKQLGISSKKKLPKGDGSHILFNDRGITKHKKELNKYASSAASNKTQSMSSHRSHASRHQDYSGKRSFSKSSSKMAHSQSSHSSHRKHAFHKHESGMKKVIHHNPFAEAVRGLLLDR